MGKKDGDYMSIDELLSANGVNQRMLVETLEKEDKTIKNETIEDIKSDIKLNRQKTEINKKKFIEHMKGSLGEEMLKNPSKIRVITKPWYKKLSDFLKKVFTRF